MESTIVTIVAVIDNDGDTEQLAFQKALRDIADTVGSVIDHPGTRTLPDDIGFIAVAPGPIDGDDAD